MPGLVACGRRWDIGSDDFVFMGIGEAVVRGFWWDFHLLSVVSCDAEDIKVRLFAKTTLHLMDRVRVQSQAVTTMMFFSPVWTENDLDLLYRVLKSFHFTVPTRTAERFLASSARSRHSTVAETLHNAPLMNARLSSSGCSKSVSRFRIWPERLRLFRCKQNLKKSSKTLGYFLQADFDCGGVQPSRRFRLSEWQFAESFLHLHISVSHPANNCRWCDSLHQYEGWSIDCSCVVSFLLGHRTPSCKLLASKWSCADAQSFLCNVVSQRFLLSSYLQGTMTDVHPRRHLGKVLYVKAAISVPELVCLILGTFWAFSDSTNCR